MGPAVAALLYASPWSLGDRVCVNNLVDHHRPGVNLFCQAPAASHVAGENAGGQTVNAVVRQPDRLFVSLEGHDWQQWTKRFVAHELHGMIDSGDDCWLMKPATRIVDTMTAGANLRATLDCIAYVILNDLQLPFIGHCSDVDCID